MPNFNILQNHIGALQSLQADAGLGFVLVLEGVAEAQNAHFRAEG